MGHRDSAVSVLVPMHSRRRRRAQRAQAAQKVQHVIATAGLVAAATQTLSSGAAQGFELGLAVAEVITSAFLIVTFVRSLRVFMPRSSHGAAADTAHTHHGIDWVDIWAAAVLFTESAEKYHTRGKIWTPSLLTAIATLGIGLFHDELASWRERQRSLRLTDEDLFVGGRPFRGVTVRWNEIRSITINEREAEILTRDGRAKKVDFDDLENAAEVRSALSTAQARLPAMSP